MSNEGTSALFPGLHVESFQWGMLMSCTLVNLIYALKYAFMHKTGKLPFFIQLSCYYFTDYTTKESIVFGVFMAIFDTLTKMLLVWYINVRLEVIASVNSRMNTLRKLFVFAGLATSILSNVLNWLPTWLGYELPGLTHEIAMAIYLVADIIIAGQDIIVGILFVGKISNSENFMQGLEYWKKVRELKVVSIILMEGIDGATWAIYATYFSFKATLTAYSLELLVKFCVNRSKRSDRAKSEGSLSPRKGSKGFSSGDLTKSGKVVKSNDTLPKTQDTRELGLGEMDLI
ncbi:hypothetical protein HK099_004415 [Clydaea vesicula]|uniref:Uncharacterized protein n=1 Tax=Clydaea vesicula TaxID=447962 RepID=A0AAD5U6X7_9FUNG|nr:hypothetical protein HK099_004415 [Clydaea vesicula]